MAKRKLKKTDGDHASLLPGAGSPEEARRDAAQQHDRAMRQAQTAQRCACRAVGGASASVGPVWGCACMACASGASVRRATCAAEPPLPSLSSPPPCPCAHRWGQPSSLVPVVRFLHGREVALGPEVFTADLAGVGTCTRTQVPVKLAWAITIHKCQVGRGVPLGLGVPGKRWSLGGLLVVAPCMLDQVAQHVTVAQAAIWLLQGLTLDLARVSLRNIFAVGQAYVALRWGGVDARQQGGGN